MDDVPVKGREAKCVKCGKTFSSYLYLSQHTNNSCAQNKDIHERKEFQCHLCEKSFIKLRYLNDHLRGVHNKPKKRTTMPSQSLECNICGRLFRSKQNLSNHASKSCSQNKDIHIKKNSNAICAQNRLMCHVT